ncbi:MAG: glucosylceramidase [Chitinophagales bacterium]|nr:glucosylceramidase [Chitinophagales bacterium]
MKGKLSNKRGTTTAIILLIGLLSIHSNCGKGNGTGTGNPPNNPPAATYQADYWITTGDRIKLLEKQAIPLQFGTTSNADPVITIDSSIKYQSVDGFGFSLTGGSAYVINQLPIAEKANLLNELFMQSDNSIGISYLRVSIGASDLNAEVFSYDDMPAGQTDTALANFSLSKDTVDVIPLLKQILSINPSIQLMGSPWSAPVWMKDNGSSIGGSLQPQYYHVYAKYFVKYIQAMKAAGITIHSITVQNEPQHGGNNPSMVMSATQQADFIKNHLGPAFQSAGITTKIIVWDHNCDHPDYPITVLNDADARKYIDGSAFHLYAGDISAMSSVHSIYPDKNLYFTEQWTGANGSFSGDLQWHMKNVVIGSVRNWGRVVLEWNLASDPFYNPHTPGGCSECKGALTVNTSSFIRNVSYYIIAHASKFVPPGSTRIESNSAGGVYTAAFVTPTGKKVLIAVNDNSTQKSFNLKYKGQSVQTSLAAGAVATYTWN